MTRHLPLTFFAALFIAVGLPPSAIAENPSDRAVGTSFQDCATCPEMVVVPAGSFRMGSLDEQKNETPAHNVTITRAFAAGVYEVTRAEFAAFVADARPDMSGGCSVWNGPDWQRHADKNWAHVGFDQTGRHPVVCISWHHATAFAAWLGDKTGQSYRLLSEAEWEYVARAGTTTSFHLGETLTTAQANYDGTATYDGAHGKGTVRHSGTPKGLRRDQTLAVGSFTANAFGLYDVHGNVWEWVADCLHEDYSGAPVDGSVYGGNCATETRVLRSGSWDNGAYHLRAAFRDWNPASNRDYLKGFRVARDLK